MPDGVRVLLFVVCVQFSCLSCLTVAGEDRSNLENGKSLTLLAPRNVSLETNSTSGQPSSPSRIVSAPATGPGKVSDEQSQKEKSGSIEETSGQVELVTERYPNGSPRVHREVTLDELLSQRTVISDKIEKTVDEVCRKLDLKVPCKTRETVLLSYRTYYTI